MESTQKNQSRPSHTGAPLCAHTFCLEFKAVDGVGRTVPTLWCIECGALNRRMRPDAVGRPASLELVEGWTLPRRDDPRLPNGSPLSRLGTIARWKRIELAAVAACAAHVELADVIEHPTAWERFSDCTRALNNALGALLETIGGAR